MNGSARKKMNDDFIVPRGEVKFKARNVTSFER
jgi:hypothetical protein